MHLYVAREYVVSKSFRLKDWRNSFKLEREKSRKYKERLLPQLANPSFTQNR